jgi:phosphinothricin acetyltransferase
MEPATVRLASEADLVSINDIYNHFVTHSTCTYQEEPESLDARRAWFAQHDETHPAIVAEVDGQVLGWGSLSAYHARAAYRRTVEDSVYVHHAHHGRGIGSLLLSELISRARRLQHRVIIAGIDAEQTASVALHAKFHFEQVGRLKQVGYKFGRWLDVIYMELLLDSPLTG